MSMHTDHGSKVTLGAPVVRSSKRRKGQRRTFVPLIVESEGYYDDDNGGAWVDDPEYLTLYLDQENFLREVAEVTGSYIERPKAPAVYDGTK